MLVTLPIGLWTFSLVADLVHLYTGQPVWATMAFYTLAGGLGGALLAAIPGLVDGFSKSARPFRKTVLAHMALVLVVLAFMGVSFYLRTTGMAGTLPVSLTAAGVVILLVAGWLGGRLVHRYGVSVDTESPELLRHAARRAYGAP